MLKSSGRRIDLSQPFVDAMLPEGHRLHVVLEGIRRGFSAVNIRKFVAPRRPAARPRRARQPDRRRPRAFLEASVRAGLNILVAGGTQAGKTTMLNCLAAAIPGGERVVSAEEVFELRFPPPRLGARCRPGSAGSRAPARSGCATWSRRACGCGRRRIIVGEVRAEECLDLLLALNAGLPGHVHAARQQRPRGAGQDVHAAAARRREHLGPLRGAHRRRRRSTSSSTSASTTHGVRRVNEIVGVPGRVENDVIETEPIFERGDGRAASGQRACRRALERFERVGIDVHRAAERGALMGAVVGLGVGVGLLLVWSAFCLPRARVAGPTAAGPARASCSTGPGSARSSPSRLRASLCVALGAASSRSSSSRWSRGRRRWRSPSA